MITVNGININPTMFPDNTSQIWHLPDEIMTSRRALIDWDFTHEGELMHIAQLRDLFEQHGIYTALHMMYLPYGRQDKAISNNKTFALETFSRLINAMNFDRVSVLDPHSRMCELIDRIQIVEPTEYINRAIEACSPTLICYPDRGARSRYESTVSFKSIHAAKTRNQQTGEIEGLKLMGDPSSEKVLIVDDLCDGGMTFIRLAERLYLGAAAEVNLYVTHGIFSKGLEPLLKAGIKRIFTRRGEVGLYAGNIIVYKPFNKETKCT